MKKSSTFRQRIRKRLRFRDGDLCCWCHRPMLFGTKHEEGRAHPPEMATIEHVIPLSEGGSEAMENLALAHYRCNTQREGRQRPKVSTAGVAAVEMLP